MLTIITPVLNGSLYLENTILSIKKLNIPYEHIIVDGGSTDGTLEIINKYPDIILIHQKKKRGDVPCNRHGYKYCERKLYFLGK